MNFVPKPIGNKLIVRFEGDLTENIAKDFETSLLETIKKEKKSIIFDFSNVNYISVDVCVCFANIYKHMVLDHLDLIVVRVNESLASIFYDIGFKDIFFFAQDLSSAMNLSKQEKGIDSGNEEVSQNLQAVAGEQQNIYDENIKFKDDVCEHWVKKGFLSAFAKKCETCKFFKPCADSGKGECTR